MDTEMRKKFKIQYTIRPIYFNKKLNLKDNKVSERALAVYSKFRSSIYPPSFYTVFFLVSTQLLLLRDLLRETDLCAVCSYL
jgi:hypothetical protein